VGVGEDAQHAEGFVVFDEAHAAHVGSELEDDVSACRGFEAAVLVLKVKGEAFDVSGDLVPLVEGLDVDGADDIDAVAEQALNEVAADETTATADYCLFSFELHSGDGLLLWFYSLKLLS
jgi:hypothetical protein